MNPRTLIKIYSTHRKGLGAPKTHPAAQTMSSPRFNHSSRSRCDPEKRHAGASGRVALGLEQIFCIQLFKNRDRLGQTTDSGIHWIVDKDHYKRESQLSAGGLAPSGAHRLESHFSEKSGSNTLTVGAP